MKRFLLTLIIIPLCFYIGNAQHFPPVTVLELFTSQGCSSCPPADELLVKIQNDKQSSHVIALSYHVDYWNYIGWKDPFSKSMFSEKQRRYSQKFNSSTIYTPQVVVNGSEHFVGSNAATMNAKVRAYAKIPAENKVEVSSIQNKEGLLFFNYEVFGNIENKSLHMALVIEERITEIPRGENRNRTLKNSNIVVSEIVVALKSANGNQKITIPELVNGNDVLKLILIVQNDDLEIVGSSQIKL